MWKNDLIAPASKLKFIQSISSGMDQYSREQLAAKGVRLASAAGVNARAVAEHALALILAVARRLPEARDNQAKRHWRGMMGEFARREDEAGGKTVVVVHDFEPQITDAHIEQLAREARQACGCGGTVREREIELQGDNPQKVRAFFESAGFRVAGV